MSLQLFNTLTQQKETFQPIRPNAVGLYVCGMTVYDFCHIGHARIMTVFDTLYRHLLACGYDVNYVRNITDIDDKIIQRAVENGEAIQVLTERFIDAMHEDERSLNVLPPNVEPKATESLGLITDMIQVLMDKGHAYLADNGDVYFSVRSFPSYGKLSKKRIEDLQVGARVAEDEAKQDPLDFVLWKAAKPHEPKDAIWSSTWDHGREGRPGWHIECSAMSNHYLGAHFDIHGGGMDLQFPHHENEIAQSECCSGGAFVNTWMHCGFVRINDEKMSKSLNNFFTIKTVLKDYHPEVIRLFLLSSHYRSPLNYSDQNLEQAKAGLTRLYQSLVDANTNVSDGSQIDTTDVDYVAFEAHMNDDLNTPQAIAVLHNVAKRLNKSSSASEQVVLAQLLLNLGQRLGLLCDDVNGYFQGKQTDGDQDIDALIQARADAKAAKDFSQADAIRDQLKAQGIELLDSASGTTWRKI